jgi:3',5'-nucleoside bisphosphate phosphatase
LPAQQAREKRFCYDASVISPPAPTLRNFDLHGHSNVSDGVHSPTEVVQLAARSGVHVFALTDHDTTDGLAQAGAASRDAGMAFVAGVEISVSWRRYTLHVVGLGVDEDNAALQAGLTQLRAGRVDRAKRMSQSLADKGGIESAFEGATRITLNPAMVGRTHFARFLVERGVAKDVKAVFKRYLVPGKPGYVEHEWAGLAEAIEWIRASGGVAVLAHPGRYDMGPNGMKTLLAEFKDLGGEAIEVVTGNHSREQVERFARHALSFGLYASRGSDFHGDEGDWLRPGRIAALPEGLRPVWELLDTEFVSPKSLHA